MGGGGNKNRRYWGFGYVGVGYGGNKGAVFVSFDYEGKRYTFVNCHLSSDNYTTRKRQFDDVLRKLNRKEFRRADYTFWGGDFNIRKHSEDDRFTAKPVRKDPERGDFDEVVRTIAKHPQNSFASLK